MKKLLKPLTRCFRRRRRRRRRRVRRAKRDVETATIEFDGKIVASDTPKESADTGDNQTAPASTSRHVHFSSP